MIGSPAKTSSIILRIVALPSFHDYVSFFCKCLNLLGEGDFKHLASKVQHGLP